MQIQINTDKNISGTTSLTDKLTEDLKNELRNFEDRVTRLEVHLSDQNAQKSGEDDIKCTIEARIEKLKPIAVTAYHGTIEQAVSLATDKLLAALNSALGKIKTY